MTIAMIFPTICSVQILLLVALMVRDAWTRRRQIGAALRHNGFVLSARGLPPMQRTPAFIDDSGATIYMLPESRRAVSPVSWRCAA